VSFRAHEMGAAGVCMRACMQATWRDCSMDLTLQECVQLCDGASSSEREAWQLGQAKDFHYLNQSSCFHLKDVNSAEEYKVHA
jgi:hypothetical protein